MNWYCNIAPGDPVHGSYHDDEYGLPRDSEEILLELLSLEIFQAGLSWELILKKRISTFKAFDGFDVDTIAGQPSDSEMPIAQQVDCTATQKMMLDDCRLWNLSMKHSCTTAGLLLQSLTILGQPKSRSRRIALHKLCTRLEIKRYEAGRRKALCDIQHDLGE